MQKRILCVHSLAGAGRCGLTVALPVLSAMGHEACCVPTVMLSTHTGGFGAPARAEPSAFFKQAAEHYKSVGIGFNCLYAGYMPSPEQPALCAELFQSGAQYFLLDPVMGDNGKMYSSLPAEMPAAMRAAASYASLITPNETEAALLLDIPYKAVKTAQEAETRLFNLSKICGGDIVITGIELADKRHVNACRLKNGETALLEYESTEQPMHGTGDLFASVLCGEVMNGTKLFEGVKSAAKFVSNCALRAEKAGLPEKYGIAFEPLLHTLFTEKGENGINV